MSTAFQKRGPCAPPASVASGLAGAQPCREGRAVPQYSSALDTPRGSRRGRGGHRALCVSARACCCGNEASACWAKAPAGHGQAHPANGERQTAQQSQASTGCAGELVGAASERFLVGVQQFCSLMWALPSVSFRADCVGAGLRCLDVPKTVVARVSGPEIRVGGQHSNC